MCVRLGISPITCVSWLTLRPFWPIDCMMGGEVLDRLQAALDGSAAATALSEA